MAAPLTPDLCIIGTAAGGSAAAEAAIALKASVVLIEQGVSSRERLESGELPAKALIAASRRVEAVRRAEDFGVKAQQPAVDLGVVYDHVRHVLDSVAPDYARERFTGLGVRVIEGSAHFKDSTTVVAGEIEIKARHFVIATGSSAAVPPIEGLDTTPYLTADTVFEFTQPKHLIVIGAGGTGLSLGQAFRRLGADVTVLDKGQPLADEDPECAAIVIEQLAREGVVVRAEADIARVTRAGGRISVSLRTPEGEETLEGSHLLVACGRTPDFAGLGLAEGGIKHGPDGIVVDTRMRTSNSRVYAIGGVLAPSQDRLADEHANIVVRDAVLRQQTALRPDHFPRRVPTDPELAHVGMTEAAARQQRHTFNILRWPYRYTERAVLERETVGHIKVVTGKKGNVLGVTVVGAQAGDLIATWTFMLHQGLTVEALAGLPMVNPALGEFGKKAAAARLSAGLTPSLVRRIMGGLGR